MTSSGERKIRAGGRVFLFLLLSVLFQAGGCEKKGGWDREKDLRYQVQHGPIGEVQRLIMLGANVNATDDRGRTPLHLAAAQGRQSVVTLLVRCGAHIDPPDDQGRTPAMLAMAKNHKAVVEYLIKQGAAVDLYLAAYVGDTTQVRKCIDGGAKVDAKDSEGRTPLHYAASRNQTEIAKLLIGAGADLNTMTGYDGATRYDSGETPLHCAIAGGHSAMVEFLIDSGADADAKNRNGITPLYCAIKEGRPEMVKLLLAKGANPNESSRSGYFRGGMPLGDAIMRGHTEIVEILIAGGAEVNAKDDFGCTALHVAVTLQDSSVADVNTVPPPPDQESPQEDWDRYQAARDQLCEVFIVRMAELLIAHGADVNDRDEEGMTPLHYAAYRGYEDVAEILIAKGADIHAKTVSDPNLQDWWEWDGGFRLGPGVTPLHEAVAGVDPNMVDFLIGHGADVNVGDDSGDTSLHYAAARSSKEMVSLLLARGADIDARDNHGATPLVAALQNGSVEEAKCLIAAGARKVILKDHPTVIHAERAERRNLLLHEAIQLPRNVAPEMYALFADANLLRDRTQWIELLLENGADVNERGVDGDTPLHTAIKVEDEDSARLLIAHGADVEAKNQTGATPLHYAACGVRKELVSLLLANGADISARENDSDTPLHNAALRGRREVVELLLAHGADPNVKNSRGRTPLDEAIRRGHDDVVQLLTGKNTENGAATQRDPASDN